MPKSYHQLTYEQRCQISTLKQSGFSQIEIAKQIGVSQSTISREIKRNQKGAFYRFSKAHKRSVTRRKYASSRAYKLNTSAINFILQALHDCDASPKQIAGRMKLEQPEYAVSHETIYRFIIKDKRKGGVLHSHLRRRGKKYNKRLAKTAGRGLIPGRVDIDQRPAIVEDKIRIGDVELDTIIGAKHKGAIVSIVDRASKFTWLRWVSKKEAHLVSAKIIEALAEYKSHIHTLTADNGKEFAKHAGIKKALKADVYFAKPYRSWERGLNEHTNGLVRQYFPKGTDFLTLTDKDVQRVQDRLNRRPRESLNFKTPDEVWSENLYAKNYALHC
jgi:IS30 family transposase